MDACAIVHQRPPPPSFLALVATPEQQAVAAAAAAGSHTAARPLAHVKGKGGRGRAGGAGRGGVWGTPPGGEGAVTRAAGLKAPGGRAWGPGPTAAGWRGGVAW